MVALENTHSLTRTRHAPTNSQRSGHRSHSLKNDKRWREGGREGRRDTTNQLQSRHCYKTFILAEIFEVFQRPGSRGES
ncbi:hypothetical protein J4Q44_G00047670 [Coregonus suidteri]|uniref:Uncharacterized protein n=1 Tax=Coregonus suidteri TaxID=861788 RepID=A0AAN8M5T2_9TELE